ncbi:MAG: NAD(P)H-hydrate epimerase [Acidimicrobiia bacterium]
MKLRFEWGTVPALTAEQMREADRIMIEELGVQLLQMMENAGRSLADLALRRFGPSSAVVLAGPGGNGGGGLAAARHLSNRGVQVAVVLVRQAMSAAARSQLEIVRAMGLSITEEPGPADLVVDGLIGYSLRGDPGGRAAALIEWANREEGPVLALDIPSGLDATTGRVGSPCIRATATLTLALPKVGLASASEVGELYLADISVPPLVFERLGMRVPDLFSQEQVVEIVRFPSRDVTIGSPTLENVPPEVVVGWERRSQ